MVKIKTAAIIPILALLASICLAASIYPKKLNAPAAGQITSQAASTTTPEVIAYPEPKKPEAQKPKATKTPVKSLTKPSPEKLREYLLQQKGPGIIGSPLAEHADRLAASDYVGLIIGICTIEQYNCTRATGWNYWGLKAGPGEKPGPTGYAIFETAELALDALEIRLAKYEQRFGSNVEDWRGRYCYNPEHGGVCPNWEAVVVRTKTKIESLQ